MNVLEQISQALQQGKKKDVETLVSQAIEQNLSVKEILENGLLSGMDIIGERFKNNEVYVPEVLVAARAMNAGLAILRPLLVSSGVKPIGTIVLGTVEGDLHDIGKNLVKIMMEGKGINVIDLGVDVSSERFIEAAKENDAIFICLSSLLTTTMVKMADVVKMSKEAGLSAKIMVGGAPVTQDFADSIGADKYCADAASAAQYAAQYIANL